MDGVFELEHDECNCADREAVQSKSLVLSELKRSCASSVQRQQGALLSELE